MESEVSKNRKNIKVNDKLIYPDAENCEKWTVSSVNDLGFEAQDEFGDFECFYFDNLQIGWDLSEKTKEYNKLYFRTEYVN